MVDQNLEIARRLTYAVYGADETFLLKSKHINISYAELCLLYILDGDQQYSQKEISRTQFFAATTVNTIIKKWEKEGIVEQIPVEGCRREKKLLLTAAGKEYAKKELALIYEAEKQAIEMTLKKYSPDFIEALEYYGECLKEFFEENQCNEKADKKNH